MSTPSRLDRHTFMNYLRQSGLFSAAQLERIATQFPPGSKPRTMARTLFDQGDLTRFQAERLLMGRTAGFVLGQYRILEQVGKGGMGRVYKAEHQTMKRIVALKVLASDLLKTERAVQLFLHEVRAISQLQHPNIVTAYDANEVGGRYYLVLEFVDGPNLDQLVRKQGPLSVGLACDYIRQAANGLQCAHLLGMVHRDIKPANIMVQWHGLNGDSSPGLVKVSDFGLARLTSPSSPRTGDQKPATIFTRENTVMGTPDYLSPEQCRNLHKTDIRGDIYSLGCTFYFLLTGQVVFPGGTALDKLIRHSTEKPAPITDFRQDVPAEVLAIIDKMMTKHPEERYQTPAELAEVLQPYAVSGPTPWAPQRSPLSLDLESLATPTDSLKSDSADDIVPLGSDGELIALASTVTGDLDATPRPELAPSRQVRRQQTEQGRFKVAVSVAIAIIGVLVAAAALVSLLGK